MILCHPLAAEGTFLVLGSGPLGLACWLCPQSRLPCVRLCGSDPVLQDLLPGWRCGFGVLSCPDFWRVFGALGVVLPSLGHGREVTAVPRLESGLDGTGKLP